MFWGQSWQNLDSERVPLKGGLEQECEMEKRVCSQWCSLSVVQSTTRLPVSVDWVTCTEGSGQT